MAAAAHFSARIYGTIEGNPPFTDGNGNTAFSRNVPFDFAGVWSLPTDGTTFVPLPNGTQVGNNYVYSVIMLPPSGLNVHGAKLVTDQSAASLATLAG